MFNNLKVGSRLFLLTAFSTAITIIVVLFGETGMNRITGNVDVMYNERAVALAQLGKVDSGLGALNADIFRAFQHDPASETSKFHASHSVAEHLDEAEKQIKIIDGAWATYTSTPLADEEKGLILQFDKDYAKYIKEIVLPTVASLHAGDFSFAAVERFNRGYRLLGVPLKQLGSDLIDVNDELAKKNFEQATKIYQSSRINMLIASVVGLLASVFIAWRIIRSIIAPLSGLQVAMGEIERNGDFTRRVEVSGTDEVGQTAASFNQ
ncbi:MAG: MCP four helix bundle domain-containing protein, partial [Azoarcus sp.]|nr:MCP four helix bundle domain-containing protein [Azoarcus sp.]